MEYSKTYKFVNSQGLSSLCLKQMNLMIYKSFTNRDMLEECILMRRNTRLCIDSHNFLKNC